MNNLTIQEALRHWWAGDQNLSRSVLWGLQIFWWARIGNMLLFLGGLTILVEIIGAERIRSIGSSALVPLGFKARWTHMSAEVRWLVLMLTSSENSPKHPYPPGIKTWLVLLPSLLLFLYVLGGHLYGNLAWRGFSWFGLFDIAVTVASALFLAMMAAGTMILALSLLLGLASIVIAIGAMFASVLVLLPIARLLSLKHNERALNVVAFCVLVAGFCLMMLGT